MAIAKEKAPKYGKMAPSIAVNGKLPKPMARVDSSTQTAMSMKETGTTTKHRVVAPTSTWTVPSTSATGKRTANMAMA